VGTIVAFERSQPRVAAAAPDQPRAATPAELIIFPTVNIAELRDLWLAMKAGFEDPPPPK
jgi:hypothetical protein